MVIITNRIIVPAFYVMAILALIAIRAFSDIHFSSGSSSVLALNGSNSCTIVRPGNNSRLSGNLGFGS